jgi:hypothetical protein
MQPDQEARQSQDQSVLRKLTRSSFCCRVKPMPNADHGSLLRPAKWLGPSLQPQPADIAANIAKDAERPQAARIALFGFKWVSVISRLFSASKNAGPINSVVSLRKRGRMKVQHYQPPSIQLWKGRNQW